MSSEDPVIQALRTRRSVRHYQPGPVDRQMLETIVDCGRLAPSSNNRQSWEFVVVTNPDTLQQLGALATFGKFIENAGACIAICGNPENRSLQLDCAAATENMLLAIHALGLASCWVQGVDKPYSDPVRQLLGIPDPLVLISLVPVAHPAREGRMPPKRGLEEVLHWETF